MKIDTWTGCYPSNWKGKIVPDAITHPAKYSSKLIRRIYEHMIEEGWLHGEKDIVVTEEERNKIITELELDNIAYQR